MAQERDSGSRPAQGVSRRQLLQLGASGAALLALRAEAQPAAPVPDGGVKFTLQEATIDDLQERMRSGQETAKGLTEKYLEHIAAVTASSARCWSSIRMRWRRPLRSIRNGGAGRCAGHCTASRCS